MTDNVALAASICGLLAAFCLAIYVRWKFQAYKNHYNEDHAAVHNPLVANESALDDTVVALRAADELVLRDEQAKVFRKELRQTFIEFLILGPPSNEPARDLSFLEYDVSNLHLDITQDDESYLSIISPRTPSPAKPVPHASGGSTLSSPSPSHGVASTGAVLLTDSPPRDGHKKVSAVAAHYSKVPVTSSTGTSTILKCGMLLKRSTWGEWQPRLFFISGGRLYYSKEVSATATANEANDRLPPGITHISAALVANLTISTVKWPVGPGGQGSVDVTVATTAATAAATAAALTNFHNSDHGHGQSHSHSHCHGFSQQGGVKAQADPGHFQIISPGSRASGGATGGGVYDLRAPGGAAAAESWVAAIRAAIQAGLDGDGDGDEDADADPGYSDAHTSENCVIDTEKKNMSTERPMLNKETFSSSGISTSRGDHSGQPQTQFNTHPSLSHSSTSSTSSSAFDPRSLPFSAVPSRAALDWIYSMNPTCADCGTVGTLPQHAAHPEWCSINLGIVLCIQCAGRHRALGAHVSKVRSLRMDRLTRGMIALLGAVGNKRSQRIWSQQQWGTTPTGKDGHRFNQQDLSGTGTMMSPVGYTPGTWPPQADSAEDEGGLSSADKAAALTRSMASACVEGNVEACLRCLALGVGPLATIETETETGSGTGTGSESESEVPHSNKVTTPLLIAALHARPLVLELLLLNGAARGYTARDCEELSALCGSARAAVIRDVIAKTMSDDDEVEDDKDKDDNGNGNENDEDVDRLAGAGAGAEADCLSNEAKTKVTAKARAELVADTKEAIEVLRWYAK